MIYLILLLKFYLTIGFQHLPFEQPKELTTINSVDLAHVLTASHVQVFGQEPKSNRLAMAWAQIALENAHGRKVYNHNLGNIGASRKTFYYKLHGHRFRAHRTFIQGGQSYWLTLQRMCASSLQYFDAGDARGAALQLSRCGYYRADPEVYSRNMQSLFFTAHRRVLDKIKDTPISSPILLDTIPDTAPIRLPSSVFYLP